MKRRVQGGIRLEMYEESKQIKSEKVRRGLQADRLTEIGASMPVIVIIYYRLPPDFALQLCCHGIYLKAIG